MPHTPGQSAEIDDEEIRVETEQCPDAEMSQIPDCGLGNNTHAKTFTSFPIRTEKFRKSFILYCLNLYD